MVGRSVGELKVPLKFRYLCVNGDGNGVSPHAYVTKIFVVDKKFLFSGLLGKNFKWFQCTVHVCSCTVLYLDLVRVFKS